MEICRYCKDAECAWRPYYRDEHRELHPCSGEEVAAAVDRAALRHPYGTAARILVDDIGRDA